ncbi:MAG: hypothetical protein RDV48_20705 [Candidatus Eremiobacteraeota bacterium]|nr:hypothetical protein [Candidatus Eremiobacteraeota bacterium]
MNLELREERETIALTRDRLHRGVTAMDTASRALLAIPLACLGVISLLLAMVGCLMMKETGMVLWSVFMIGCFGFFAVLLLSVSFWWMRDTAMRIVLGIKRLAARMRHPGSAVIADYPWNAAGIYDDYYRRLLTPLMGAFFSLLIGIAFAGYDHFYPDASLASAGSEGRRTLIHFVFYSMEWACLLAFLFCAALVSNVYLNQGRHFMIFREFPFHPGAMVRCALRHSRTLSEAKRLVITLRHIEEKLVPSEKQKGAFNHLCFQAYSVTAALDMNRAGRDEEGNISIELPVPPDAPGTRLRSAEPCYWELEFYDEAKGSDNAVRFLIPLYREEGSPQCGEGAS